MSEYLQDMLNLIKDHDKLTILAAGVLWGKMGEVDIEKVHSTVSSIEIQHESHQSRIEAYDKAIKELAQAKLKSEDMCKSEIVQEYYKTKIDHFNKYIGVRESMVKDDVFRMDDWHSDDQQNKRQIKRQRKFEDDAELYKNAKKQIAEHFKCWKVPKRPFYRPKSKNSRTKKLQCYGKSIKNAKDMIETKLGIKHTQLSSVSESPNISQATQLISKTQQDSEVCVICMKSYGLFATIDLHSGKNNEKHISHIKWMRTYLKNHLQNKEIYEPVICPVDKCTFETQKQTLLKCLNTESEKCEIECNSYLSKYNKDKSDTVFWCLECKSFSTGFYKNNKCDHCKPTSDEKSPILQNVIKLFKQTEKTEDQKLCDRIMAEIRHMFEKCDLCNNFVDTKKHGNDKTCKCVAVEDLI